MARTLIWMPGLHRVRAGRKYPMTQEHTKDWVRLLPWAVLTMNSQRSSSTGFTPHELFHGGRPAWFFKTAFLEDYKSPIWDWLEQKQDLANLARAQKWALATECKECRVLFVCKTGGTFLVATFWGNWACSDACI